MSEKVYGKVVGGTMREFDLEFVSTPRELKAAMGLSGDYSAQTMDKEPIGLDEQLEADSFILFSAAVKGGHA